MWPDQVSRDSHVTIWLDDVMWPDQVSRDSHVTIRWPVLLCDHDIAQIVKLLGNSESRRVMQLQLVLGWCICWCQEDTVTIWHTHLTHTMYYTHTRARTNTHTIPWSSRSVSGIRYPKSYLIYETNSQSILLKHPAQRKQTNQSEVRFKFRLKVHTSDIFINSVQHSVIHALE